jgi:Transposase DDE domain
LLEEVNLDPCKVLSLIQSEAKERSCQSASFGEALEPKSKAAQLNLSLDRSEWSSNGQKINILTLAVAYKDVALPLLVEDLDKAGCSNSDERIRMLEALLDIVTPEDIKVLSADREFASVAFLTALHERNVNFALRLTSDTLITINNVTKAARAWFTSKNVRSFRNLHVYGVSVNVAGYRLKNGDFLIVITNLDPEQGLQLYKERWRIESLFGILKSRGFHLELSRLTSPDKLERLIIFLGLAILWALRIGELVCRKHPTRLMPNGYPLFSLFRRGLDALPALLIETDSRFVSWNQALKVLSCA